MTISGDILLFLALDLDQKDQKDLQHDGSISNQYLQEYHRIGQPPETPTHNGPMLNQGRLGKRIAWPQNSGLEPTFGGSNRLRKA